MKIVMSVVAVGLLGLGLAGCETARESSAAAVDTCRDAGLRPGTRAYANCYHQNYAMNREDARSTDNAVAAGVVGGLVGGIVAAGDRPYYGRCWRWGC